MTAVLALSIGSRVDHYGAIAGVAAILGLGVLAVLYAAQAREVKRLREWAGRSPERDAELQQRVVAEAQRRTVAPPVVVPQPAVRTQPATPAGAAVSGGAAAAAPAMQLPGPATPAGVPAAIAATAAAGAAATAAGAPSPARPPVQGTPPPAPATGAPAVPVVAGVAATAATTAAAAAAAKPGGPAPAAPAGATSPPAAAGVTAAAVTKPPAAAGVATTPPPPPATPAAQPTMIVPPAPAVPDRPRAAAAPLRTTAREATATPPADRTRRNLAVVVFGGVAIIAIAVLLITQVFNGDSTGTKAKPNKVVAPGATTTTAGSQGSSSLPPIDRTATTVSVLNGTAVQGLARGASTKLVTRGYTEGIVKTNVDQQVPSTTVYYARGANRQARDVARILGLDAGVVKSMVPAIQAAGGTATVVVVVGLDQAQ